MYSGSLREAKAEAVSRFSSSVASTITVASSPPHRGQVRGTKSSFIPILCTSVLGMVLSPPVSLRPSLRFPHLLQFLLLVLQIAFHRVRMRQTMNGTSVGKTN